MADNVVIKGPDGSNNVYENVSEVALATEDGGMAIFAHTDDIPEQKQADMAQTDTAALDFVKNQYFGVLPDNLTAKEFAFKSSPYNIVGRSAVDFDLSVPLVIGQTYVVTWGETEWTLVAKDCADIGTSLGVTAAHCAYIGNSSFVGLAWGAPDWGEDTGEPFMIVNGSAGSPAECNTNDLTIESLIIGVRLANNTKKLDSQWLPDGLATETFVEEKIAAIDFPEGSGGDGVGLPEVTANDNGKVLGVVDGAWAKMDAPSGGGQQVDYVPNTIATNGYLTSPFRAYCIVVPVDKQTYDAWCTNTKPVTVMYDGREYTCSPQETDLGKAVGDLSALGGTGNGEPFAAGCVVEEDDPNNILYLFVIASTVDTVATDHMVHIYQKTPLSVRWNNVTDKPFGEETATIFEGTFQDELYDGDGDGVNDSWMCEAFIEDASDATIVDGETYAVTFDGVKYELVCFSSGGLPALGSSIVFTGAPDGVPFIIARDTTGGRLLDAPGWLLVLVDGPTDLTISGAYTCKIEGVSVKKLDNKYLDILEGEAKPETEIFAEQTVEGFALDDPNYTESPYMAIVNHIVDFVPGETYRVFWDGVEYEMVAGNREGVGALGNLDAGDPFEMLGAYGSLFVLTTDKTTTSHKIRIYQPASDTVAIKEKYIPILETVSETQELLAEITFTNEYFADLGAFGQFLDIDEATYNAWSANTEPVIVRYDGAEYVLEPQSIDPFGSGQPGIGVGNLAAFGGTGNGEPFAIAALFDVNSDGNMECGFLCGSMVDTTPTDHTIAVYLQTEAQKVKEEYIPDSVKLPTFTAEDEGKVLRIVNGVPQWVSLST